jgi:hypothetical protein
LFKFFVLAFILRYIEVQGETLMRARLTAFILISLTSISASAWSGLGDVIKIHQHGLFGGGSSFSSSSGNPFEIANAHSYTKAYFQKLGEGVNNIDVETTTLKDGANFLTIWSKYYDVEIAYDGIRYMCDLKIEEVSRDRWNENYVSVDDCKSINKVNGKHLYKDFKTDVLVNLSEDYTGEKSDKRVVDVDRFQKPSRSPALHRRGSRSSSKSASR